jgi:hypothetical protein
MIFGVWWRLQRFVPVVHLSLRHHPITRWLLGDDEWGHAKQRFWAVGFHFQNPTAWNRMMTFYRHHILITFSYSHHTFIFQSFWRTWERGSILWLKCLKRCIRQHSDDGGMTALRNHFRVWMPRYSETLQWSRTFVSSGLVLWLPDIQNPDSVRFFRFGADIFYYRRSQDLKNRLFPAYRYLLLGDSVVISHCVASFGLVLGLSKALFCWVFCAFHISPRWLWQWRPQLQNNKLTIKLDSLPPKSLILFVFSDSVQQLFTNVYYRRSQDHRITRSQGDEVINHEW